MEDTNPFSPPVDVESSYVPQTEDREVIAASTGRRFLNFVLDYIFVQVFVVVVGIGFLLIDKFETFEEIPDILLGIIMMTIYYVPMEFGFGKSIAKFITGTRVVTADGGSPSLGQIVGRTFARFIPFEPFSFFGGKGHPVGWHDSLSGTRVIRDR